MYMHIVLFLFILRVFFTIVFFVSLCLYSDFLSCRMSLESGIYVCIIMFQKTKNFWAEFSDHCRIPNLREICRFYRF